MPIIRKIIQKNKTKALLLCLFSRVWQTRWFTLRVLNYSNYLAKIWSFTVIMIIIKRCTVYIEELIKATRNTHSYLDRVIYLYFSSHTSRKRVVCSRQTKAFEKLWRSASLESGLERVKRSISMLSNDELGFVFSDWSR